MIEIEKGTKTRLPKKYHLINNICAYMYDHIGEVLTEPYYIEMHSTSLDIEKDPELANAIKDETGHILDVLSQVNRKDEIELIIVKHVVMSIIADMSNFLYESIIIAQKMKISVAFALLRKPFIDQLLILEQILIDRADFTERFFHDGNPQNYDPSAKHLDKRLIIENALKKLNFVMFQSDFIYELRYDKASSANIQAMANHALHIVTNDRNYRTEHHGLNFTFPLEEEDLDQSINYYYTAVPMLLTYTASIVDAIVFEIIEDPLQMKVQKMFQQVLAFAMIRENMNPNSSKEVYSIFGKILITTCDICKHKNKFTKKDFHEYFSRRFFTCKKCYNPLMLSTESLEAVRSTLQNLQPTV